MSDEKLYRYHTTDDAEKAIMDISIQTDINYSCNNSLLCAVLRFINCTMLISICCYEAVSMIMLTFDFKTLIYLLIIYCIFLLISNYVKFCFYKEFEKAKQNLINNILMSCKDWQEKDIEEWQRKIMFKRFCNIAGLNVEFKNDKDNQ